MDWARAIERNSEALKAIVVALFAMLGRSGSAPIGRIAKPLHRAVLRILQPAESAVRRLIVIAARGLVAKPTAARQMPKGHVIGKGNAKRSAFPLFDPRKRFAHQRRSSGRRAMPRILNFWPNPHLVPLWQPQPTFAPVKPADDGQVDASRLSRRLEALKLALDDLPRQARRLVRARARRDKVPSLALQSPLRPGRPPGYRKKPTHEIDFVLAECHGLARDVLAPDTS